MTRYPRSICRNIARDRQAVVVFGIVASWLAVVGPARAADPTDVEALIGQGNDLRRQGRDQAALPLFRQAYDLGRSPRTAAQLGLAELSMGYALEAERHLAEALASPRHLWVVRNRAQIEAAHKEASAAIGIIEVSGSPAGAAVLVNGKLAGALPLTDPLRWTEGLVQVTVRADGFEDTVKDIKLIGGSRAVVVVALAPSPGKAAAKTARGPADTSARKAIAAANGDVSQGVHHGSGPAPASDEATSAPAWVPPVAWVATTLAATALGFGGYNWWRLQESQSSFNDLRVPGTDQRVCSTAVPNNGTGPCNEYHQDGQSARTRALLSLPAAGVFAAVAVIGFVWVARTPSQRAAVARSKLVATVDRAGVSAGWRLQF